MPSVRINTPKSFNKLKLRMGKPVIFVSYSHKDEEWCERVVDHLGCLDLAADIETWIDSDIDTGDKWYTKIREKLDNADIVVCLISKHFLKSEFCIKDEMEYLIEKYDDTKTIFPILISPCYWKVYDWISETQMLPKNKKNKEDKENKNSLEHFNKVEQEQIIADAVADIHSKLDEEKTKDKADNPPFNILYGEEFLDQKTTFVGRKMQLKRLDKALKEEENIISIVGHGGTGKSALIRKWITKSSNGSKFEKVLIWSFYQQGTKEQSQSVDQFFITALRKLNVDVADSSSTDYKAQRLADEIQQKKLLLVIDGAETIQDRSELGQDRDETIQDSSEPDQDKDEPIQDSSALGQDGNNSRQHKFRNPAFTDFLSRLSIKNPGLCVLLSRLSMPISLVTQKDEIKLEQFEPGTARALLRVSDFTGKDSDLIKLADRFGNQALALHLLTKNSADFDHSYEKVQSTMANYGNVNNQQVVMHHLYQRSNRFEQKFLQLLGLFDRPIELETLRALIPIDGLLPKLNSTKPQTELSADNNIFDDYLIQITNILKNMGLIERLKIDGKNCIDCHPLVREFFEQEIDRNVPLKIKGNKLLFAYYQEKIDHKKDLKSLDDTEHLILAIKHGCSANQADQAFELYYDKVIEKPETEGTQNKSLIIDELGSLELDFACLSYFFDNKEAPRPWQTLINGIEEDNKDVIYAWMAHALRGLGWLKEAELPLQKSLELRKGLVAANTTHNLAELYLIRGDLLQTKKYAKEGMSIAKETKKTEYQYVDNAAIEGLRLFYEGNMLEAIEGLKKAEALNETVAKAKLEPKLKQQLDTDIAEVNAKLTKPRDKEMAIAKLKAKFKQQLDKEAKYLFGLTGFYYCQVLLYEAGSQDTITDEKLEALISRSEAVLINAEQYGVYLYLAFLTKAHVSYLRKDWSEAEKYINMSLKEFQKVGFANFKCLALLMQSKIYKKRRSFTKAWAALDGVYLPAKASGMKLLMIEYHLNCCDLIETLLESTDKDYEIIIESKQRKEHRNSLPIIQAEQIEKLGDLIKETNAGIYKKQYDALKQKSDLLYK